VNHTCSGIDFKKSEFLYPIRAYSAGKPKSVPEALKWRFKRVPADLREEIHRADDMAKLQSLLRAAITSPTLDAFAKEL
jgi:hypothetical protein